MTKGFPVIEEQDIAAKADGLKSELQRAFGVKSATLAKALHKTGRRLPGHLHEKAGMIVQAQEFSGNPKLMRILDSDNITKGYDEVVAHLKQIDPQKRRLDIVVNMLGELAWKLLIIAGVLVGFLIWKGYL